MKARSKFTEIYALSVCFIAAVVFLFNLSTAGWSLVQAVVPSVSISSSERAKYLSNTAYWEWLQKPSGESLPGVDGRPQQRPSEDILTRERQSSLKEELNMVREDSLREGIPDIIYLIVSAVIYVLHWRMAGKNRLAEPRKDL